MESDLKDNSQDGEEVLREEPATNSYNGAYESASLWSFQETILRECIEDISYLAHNTVSIL